MDAVTGIGADGEESFASYLAKYYVATQGFTRATEAEVGALAAACDFVLLHSDGAAFQVKAIVDCGAAPDRTFRLTGEELRRLGQEYLERAGATKWAKARLQINVLEIGPKLASSDRQARLMALSESSSDNFKINSWALDTSAKSVWTNAGIFNGLFSGRKELERLLKGARLDSSRLQPPLPVAAPTPAVPFVTYGLLAIIAAAFACEIKFGLDQSTGFLQPSIATLAALGVTYWPSVVDNGEWFRLISATFLHADLTHLLLNSLVLFLAGRMLERVIGHAWFAATYAFAAVCGALMSLAVNPTNIVGVGASGAIMGILAAALVSSFRFPPGSVRTRLQTMSMQVLIPSLLPLAPAATGHHVDFGAHIGGALGGALIAGLMLRLWPREAPVPKLVAIAVAATWMIGAAVSAALVVPSYAKAQHEGSLRALLMPDSEVRRGAKALTAESNRLVEQYPHDPRAQFYRATQLLESGKLKESEQPLRAALDEQDILKTLLSPAFEDALRTLLSVVLAETNRKDEAKIWVEPVCGRLQTQPEALREHLKSVCN